MHSRKSSVILSSCFSPTMSLTFPMGQFICRRGRRSRRKLSNRAEGAITKYSAASPDPPLNTLNKHIKRKQKERTSLWLCSIFLNDFCYVIIIIVRGSRMKYIIFWHTVEETIPRPKEERYPRIELVAYLKKSMPEILTEENSLRNVPWICLNSYALNPPPPLLIRSRAMTKYQTNRAASASSPTMPTPNQTKLHVSPIGHCQCRHRMILESRIIIPLCVCCAWRAFFILSRKGKGDASTLSKVGTVNS